MNRNMGDASVVIDIIVPVFTIVGINFFDYVSLFLPGVQIPGWIKLVFSSVLMAILVVRALTRERFRTQQTLPEDSEVEARFFEDWYSRPGKLMIFCTDLEWLDDPKYTGVVQALKTKGDHLSLFLKEYDHPIVGALTARGVHLYKVRPGIRTEHRFSIRIDEHLKSIIIRDKEVEPRKISFEEYLNHPVLVNLTLDMLELLKEQDKEQLR